MERMDGYRKESTEAAAIAIPRAYSEDPAKWRDDDRSAYKPLEHRSFASSTTTRRTAGSTPEAFSRPEAS